MKWINRREEGAYRTTLLSGIDNKKTEYLYKIDQFP